MRVHESREQIPDTSVYQQVGLAMVTKSLLRSLVIAIAFAAVLLGSAKAQSADAFTFSEPPGPLPVGVQVVQQYDLSRGISPSATSAAPVQPKEQARHIQTLVWYPAQTAKARSMRVADYAKLLEQRLPSTNRFSQKSPPTLLRA